MDIILQKVNLALHLSVFTGATLLFAVVQLVEALCYRSEGR
jgi:hypothetical protein